ncbi:MAG: hypothetical protein KY475_19740 [Planctomycetes bacterium]|nr:hypothetical protein [Planctomycetota bacterium]
MNAETGDKIRVKAGEHAGKRGVVVTISDRKLEVRLEHSGATVRVGPEQITNYSLAARKAWATEPRRAVGRRKGTKFTDRVSVTLRIDRDLWEQFLTLENAGVIDNRTELINGWLRDLLSGLKGRQS